MKFSIAAAALAFAPQVFAGLTYKGVDWSSVPIEEKAGYSFKSANGNSQAIEKIFKTAGVNTVRQRVWANGQYDLNYNLALAKRAEAAGLGVYLDLHLSDTWADPTQQSVPSGWPVDTIENLSWAVYSYTLLLSNSMSDAGISPSIISIGNEIRDGFLWPLGTTSSFWNIADLLHSASAGIKNSKLGSKPKIMIHLDNGWNWSDQQYFYQTVLAAGPLKTSDFDMMGVSYYPFYTPSATLANLKTTLKNMASAWGKELVVAETNWPFACPKPAYAFPADAKSNPLSASGQATWIKDVAAAVAGTKGGAGFFYWEPSWIQNAGLGSSCSDNLLFEYSGQARGSLSAFASI